jgi:hypothetical protein
MGNSAPTLPVVLRKPRGLQPSAKQVWRSDHDIGWKALSVIIKEGSGLSERGYCHPQGLCQDESLVASGRLQHE